MSLLYNYITRFSHCVDINVGFRNFVIKNLKGAIEYLTEVITFCGVTCDDIDKIMVLCEGTERYKQVKVCFKGIRRCISFSCHLNSAMVTQVWPHSGRGFLLVLL